MSIVMFGGWYYRISRTEKKSWMTNVKEWIGFQLVERDLLRVHDLPCCVSSPEVRPLNFYLRYQGRKQEQMSQ